MTQNRFKIPTDEIPPELLTRAGHILRSGGVVLHPTETVYGLAAHWEREEALQRIARIKGRSPAQPFTLMVASIEDILRISGYTSELLQRFLKAVFPVPLTVLLPHRQTLPVAYWRQFPVLGFRMPDHRPSLQLVQAAGAPLVTTSANLTGQSPPKALQEVPDAIVSQVDLTLDGGLCRFQVPSTIIQIDPEQWTYQLIRPGAFPVAKINRFFDRR